MATLLPSRDPSSLVLPSTVTAQDSPQVCMNPTCAILPSELKYIPKTSPVAGTVLLFFPLVYIVFLEGK